MGVRLFELLVVGGATVLGSICITLISIGILIHFLTPMGPWLCRPPFGLKTIVALFGVTVWLLFAFGLSVLSWAFAFLYLGAVDDLEAAVYFASVTYTTVGYGDLVLPVGSRILSGVCAANGLLMFGVFTAFLVEFLRRLRQSQLQQ